MIKISPELFSKLQQVLLEVKFFSFWSNVMDIRLQCIMKKALFL